MPVNKQTDDISPSSRTPVNQEAGSPISSNLTASVLPQTSKIQHLDEHKELESNKHSTLSFDPMRNMPDSRHQNGHLESNTANALNVLTTQNVDL